MVAGIPEAYVNENAAIVDPYMPIVLDVQMRFGKWDELLKEPKPRDILPITNAFWHFTRGVAYAAKGRIGEAQAEKFKC